MERTIQKYKELHPRKVHHDYNLTHPEMEHWEEETAKLRQQNDILKYSISQLMGEALTSLTITDLGELEIRVEMGLKRVRSKKEEKLLEEIDNSKSKEYLLQASNQFLTGMINESESYTNRAELEINESENNTSIAELEMFPRAGLQHVRDIETAVQLV